VGIGYILNIEAEVVVAGEGGGGGAR